MARAARAAPRLEFVYGRYPANDDGSGGWCTVARAVAPRWPTAARGTGSNVTYTIETTRSRGYGGGGGARAACGSALGDLPYVPPPDE